MVKFNIQEVIDAVNEGKCPAPLVRRYINELTFLFDKPVFTSFVHFLNGYPQLHWRPIDHRNDDNGLEITYLFDYKDNVITKPNTNPLNFGIREPPTNQQLIKVTTDDNL